MRRILGIIAFIIGWRIFTIMLLSSVLVQIVYMYKRISIDVFSEIPFCKNPQHTETSQLICFPNQLPGFNTIRVLTERYFRADLRLSLNCHELFPNDIYVIYVK